MKNNKHGMGLILIGLMLIAAALLLTAKNLREITEAKAASQAVLEELLPVVEKAEEEARAISAETGENSGARKTAGTAVPVPDYILNPDMDMPVEEIKGNRYIGVLSVPDLELVLPVMENWSYPNLAISPCRYSGTAYKKDFVLCAHNYETHFGNLKYLDIGSEISFTDVDGNVFLYEVAEIETLQPTAIGEMVSGGWDLTLFTCTIGGATRVTVRCMLRGSEL